METLKNLLGSAWHDDITVEEIDKFLASGKYVNVKDGGYVSKEKYERLESEHKELQTKHTELAEQTKDYETIKAENETFKTEKATGELKAKLGTLGIKDTAFKYVKSDIDAKELVIGEDEKANKENVAKYLKDHPEFAVQQAKRDKPVITVSTKVGNEGADTGKSQAEKNADINLALREAIGVSTNKN